MTEIAENMTGIDMMIAEDMMGIVIKAVTNLRCHNLRSKESP